MSILLRLALLWTLSASPAFAAPPGVVALTHELDGVEITYTYGNGGAYNVKYTRKGVMYRFLSGDAPGAWWGPFPYKAYKTSKGEYFLGWYEKEYGDQITHLVDLEEKTLYGSGIIVKGEGKSVIEHFQKARITEIKRAPPEPGALK